MGRGYFVIVLEMGSVGLTSSDLISNPFWANTAWTSAESYELRSEYELALSEELLSEDWVDDVVVVRISELLVEDMEELSYSVVLRERVFSISDSLKSETLELMTMV